MSKDGLPQVPIITAIDRIKGKRRALIALAAGEPLTLRLDTILEHRLDVGVEVSNNLRAELEAEDQRRTAIEAALRLIAIGPRSERDLRARLLRRGLAGPAIDAAIDRMRDLGYLNDAAFARHWVETRQSMTPRSRRYLTLELGQKGVSRDIAVAATERVSDVDAAYAAAQRRLRQLHDLDFQTFQRRLGSFLANRGFGYGTARATIERCWRELHEADS